MARYTKAQIRKALIDHKGMKYLASKGLGCSYHTIEKWVAKHEDLRLLIHVEEGKVTDMAELKLYEAITLGDLDAIKYRLSRKAKDRGYGDHLTAEVKGEITHRTIADLAKSLPDDHADQK